MGTGGEGEQHDIGEQRGHPCRSANTMLKTQARRLGLLLSWVLALMLVNPVASHAADQVSGAAYYDATQCPGPPTGYEDFTTYDGLVLTGSIEGCLYTKVTSSKQTPGGMWIESGEEVIVGSLNDGAEGTFATGYRFEGRFYPGSGAQQHGRCQHPIVRGSGVNGFAGAEGRLSFKDIIGNPTTYIYWGHINLG